VAACLPNRADATEVARMFVAELPVHIGLLDEVQPDRFRFSHLSFQEFLAARHIAETDQWDALLQHYQENWWREVILLCAGHLSQSRCWRFLERLITQGKTADQRAAALGLAAAALAELERFKGQGPLNEQIAEGAVAIVEIPVPGATAQSRLTAGRALGIVGDPRYPVTLDEWRNSMTPPPTPDSRSLTRYWCSVRPGIYCIGGWEDGEKSADHDLPGFWIARYPLTVAQYRAFIDGGGYQNKDYWTKQGWNWKQESNRTQPYLWGDAQYSSPNQAVIGVTWYESMAFCAWLAIQLATALPAGFELRLPTEAEWEAAAAYDTQMQRHTYPWGETEPTPEHAIFEDDQSTNLGAPALVGVCPTGAAACGALDMGGQVWEWCCSSYGAYPQGANIGHNEFKRGEQDVPLRGGAWRHNKIYVRCTARYGVNPIYRLDGSIGLRVVLSPRVPSHSR
jgi:formylglycine-generating enzyme required for sulfatase activity